MKKIVLILVVVFCMGIINKVDAVRFVNAWTFNSSAPLVGGHAFGIWGLLPYYEENGEVWIVLGLYSYDDGTQALSAAVEYNTMEVHSMNISAGFEKFFTESLKSVGINSSVKHLDDIRARIQYHAYYSAKIEKNQIGKLKALTKNLNTFVSVKFSDLYTMKCNPAQLNKAFRECLVAGIKRIFLNEFIVVCFEIPDHKAYLNKIFGAQMNPVLSSPTTPIIPLPIPASPIGSGLQKLSLRLNDLSLKI